MRTVRFDDYDSYRDFGLLLRPKERPFPEPKTNYVSIEGKSGDIDLTDALTGDVAYENIEYSLEFNVIDAMSEWDEKLRYISTRLHGKKMKVIFSEDPDWYYVGRITLNELSTDKSLGILALECNFDPYKMALNETVVEKTVTANDIIILSNERKWVMPIVESTGDIVFKFEDKQFSISSTTTLQSPDLTLKEGNNEITIVSGTGTLKFTYREGCL